MGSWLASPEAGGSERACIVRTKQFEAQSPSEPAGHSISCSHENCGEFDFPLTMTPNPISKPVDVADSMHAVHMAVVLAEVCRSNYDRLASADQLPDGENSRLTLTTSMLKERRDAGMSKLGRAGNAEPAAAGGSMSAEAQLAPR